jgi:hypothetical protein
MYVLQDNEDPFAMPLPVEPDLDDDDFARRGASSPVPADEWLRNANGLDTDFLEPEPAFLAYSGYNTDPTFGKIVISISQQGY